jgi:hypothetical protein
MNALLAEQGYMVYGHFARFDDRTISVARQRVNILTPPDDGYSSTENSGAT